MERRDFIKKSATIASLAFLSHWEKAFSIGTKDKEAGRPWKGWKQGQFQVHFIYTGVAESMFIIMPDGTTMLLDCGDHNAIGRGKLAVPVLPDSSKHSGEWISRYVRRVNPAVNDVDYMMLSHYHSDHGGCGQFNAGTVQHDDGPYPLSGFSHAAEFLNFNKAIDRAWPTYDDPIQMTTNDGNWEHMCRFYDYMTKQRNLKVEKFKLGATDQIVQVHKPAKYPDFIVRNICANGRICGTDGNIRDLYAERIAKEHPHALNENGMSLGMIFEYGPFRFYTAGDFSDGWNLADGSRFEIENALADVCGKVNVAKINHHGHYSMPTQLVKALQARVYISCVWDQLHNVAPVMARLADKTIYPGERIVCPGIMPAERRKEDSGATWTDVVNKASHEGGHVVLNVEKGGKDYSVTYLTAEDESMVVRSVMRFRTEE